MIGDTKTEYRRYEGSIRPRPLLAWWPITRSELTTRVFRWRFVLLYLVAFGPLLFREAILYARFVIAPVQVSLKAHMASGRMSRLMLWDHLDFYSDYLEDKFLWTLLLLATGVLAVPMVARDLRTRAWEIYFSRSIGRLDYFLGKFAAVFLVLFTLTGGGVLCLYLTTALLGPDPDFFLTNLGWLAPLFLYSVLLSGILALAALAFGTFSENGLLLAGSWLGMFFVAFCIGRVMRWVRPGGAFDWIDPRLLFMEASSVIHGHASMAGFPSFVALGLLGLMTAVALVILVQFLRRQKEGIG